MSVFGSAILQVVAIHPSQEPSILTEQVYTPREFHEAYRNGMTGTHYTLETVLPPDLSEGIGQVTVKVVFTEAATGVKHHYEQAIDVSP